MSFKTSIAGICRSGNIEVTGGGTPNFDFVAKSSLLLATNLQSQTHSSMTRSISSSLAIGAFPSMAPTIAPSLSCPYCRFKERCFSTPGTITNVRNITTLYENCANGYRYASFMADAQDGSFSLSGTAADTCSSSIISNTMAFAEVENECKSSCQVWIEGPDCCLDQYDVACNIDVDLIAEIHPPNKEALDDDFITAVLEFETPCFSTSLTILMDKESGATRHFLQDSSTTETVIIGNETFSFENITEVYNRDGAFWKKISSRVKLKHRHVIYRNFDKRILWLRETSKHSATLSTKKEKATSSAMLFEGHPRLSVRHLLDEPEPFKIKTPAVGCAVRG
jgi:hypothetical protein